MPNLIKNVAGIADLEIHDELIAVDYVSDRAVIVNGLEIILTRGLQAVTFSLQIIFN